MDCGRVLACCESLENQFSLGPTMATKINKTESKVNINYVSFLTIIQYFL